MPEYTGYVSRTLNKKYGSLVVTQDASDALTVVWDPKSPTPQTLYILNNTEGHDWLALRFTEDSPNYLRDRYLSVATRKSDVMPPRALTVFLPRWATFTAASGSLENYDTVWTQNSPGLDLLPQWECSASWDLTPRALGGIKLDCGPRFKQATDGPFG
ncbi:hypothetical protein FRC00_000614 [Tulasnella sp. 408]|nr:hypothetical protein FRC00_000614 [Tulasnella sp. 408]